MRIAPLFLLLLSILPSIGFAETKPNIIFILADDWGIGDVKCFGGELCRIETPHMDALAKRGMRFTDAHSSSSVCTPTRYSVLTGRYNWRSRLKRGVLYGYDEPLIEAKRQTVAGFLQQQGYQTACIGKWHLGMNMPTHDGKRPFSKMTAKDHDKPVDPAKCNVDWKGLSPEVRPALVLITSTGSPLPSICHPTFGFTTLSSWVNALPQRPFIAQGQPTRTSSITTSFPG